MPSETGRVREKASRGKEPASAKALPLSFSFSSPVPYKLPHNAVALSSEPQGTLWDSSHLPRCIFRAPSHVSLRTRHASVSPEPGTANALMNKRTDGSGTSVFIPSVLRALSVRVHPDFQLPPIFAYLALGTRWVLRKCFLC